MPARYLALPVVVLALLTGCLSSTSSADEDAGFLDEPVLRLVDGARSEPLPPSAGQGALPPRDADAEPLPEDDAGSVPVVELDAGIDATVTIDAGIIEEADAAIPTPDAGPDLGGICDLCPGGMDEECLAGHRCIERVIEDYTWRCMPKQPPSGCGSLPDSDFLAGGIEGGLPAVCTPYEASTITRLTCQEWLEIVAP